MIVDGGFCSPGKIDNDPFKGAGTIQDVSAVFERGLWLRDIRCQPFKGTFGFFYGLLKAGEIGLCNLLQ
jgi:hypothetical protein